MSGEPVFVETSVLVYARDSRDPRKQQRAEAWLVHLWRHRTGRLSPQVLQEYYVSVTQKLKPGMDLESARRDVRDLWPWVPGPSTVDLLETAWLVRTRDTLPPRVHLTPHFPRPARAAGAGRVAGTGW